MARNVGPTINPNTKRREFDPAYEAATLREVLDENRRKAEEQEWAEMGPRLCKKI
jgi:hypothetical protein